MTIPEGIGRYQGVVRRLLKPLVHRLWRLDIEGLEHLPAAGPAVLCPNHAAAIDSLFLPAMLDRNLIYVGKSEYLDDWKTRWLFPALGMIPLDRRGGDHAAAALDAARSVLERGDLFGIYPEGTRSRTGRLHKGHTGAARLAVETGAPIIPVGLIGTTAVQPVDRVLPRFGLDVGVRFGRPITVDRYVSRVGDRAMYRELTDEVMYEIQQLTGLDYDPTYATSRRTAEAAPAPASSAEPSESSESSEGVAGPEAAELGGEATIGRASSRDLLASTPARSLEEMLAAT